MSQTVSTPKPGLAPNPHQHLISANLPQGVPVQGPALGHRALRDEARLARAVHSRAVTGSPRLGGPVAFGQSVHLHTNILTNTIPLHNLEPKVVKEL